MARLLDLGNSYGKLVKYTNNEFGNVTRFSSLTPQDVVDELKAKGHELSAIASVKSDEFNAKLLVLMEEADLAKPFMITQSQKSHAGLLNVYKEYHRLGVDRWLVMLGARSLFNESPLAVFDFGTAITLDLIAADGQHIGGHIVPNEETIIRAITQRTDRVVPKNLPDENEQDFIGNDTDSCLRKGAQTMIKGYVERSVASAMTRFGKDLKILITGGGFRKEYCSDACSYFQDDHLIFRGMIRYKG